jgi:hypothetical protein
MTEQDIKDLMYGSIRELTQSRTYFYKGYRSHFTDEGRRILTELMDLYAPKIEEAVKAADEARAKEMVFSTLKEDSNGTGV